jgi:glutathione S-transferase
MNKNLELLTSTIASSMRLWRGTWGDKPSHTPAKLLVLFDREDDAECRLVREALTELNFDAMIYPCPIGGTRFASKREKLAPGTQLPALHDPNTGKTLLGAETILPYLHSQYLTGSGKDKPTVSPLNMLAAQLAGLVRSPMGIAVRESIRPKKDLVLYSFESSPYSRPVRECLCELELPYHLINLGKLQWAELGPASARLFGLGQEYKPVPGSKREAFLKEHGKVQLPFLIDPNKKVRMFESTKIIAYLERTYAKV